MEIKLKMQTFLPYKSFSRSASCLDYRRLGKQRVEAFQILLIIYGHLNVYRNHPVVKMWKDYRVALKHYYNKILIEWIRRGYKNTMQPFSVDPQTILYPEWLGNKHFHNSHKSNLLRKDPVYYGKFNWEVKNNLPYIWILK